MERREFLGGTVVALSSLAAGCLAHPGDKICLKATPVSVADAVTDTTTSLEEIDGDATVILSDAHSESVPDVRAESRRVASDAIDHGTANSYGIVLLDDPAFVATEDAYYRIDPARTGQETVDRTILRAEVLETESPGEEPVPLDDLEPPTRGYVRSAVMGNRRYRSITEEEDDTRRDGLLDRAGLDSPPLLAAVDEQLTPGHPYFVHVFRESDADPTVLGLAPEPEPAYVQYPRGATKRLSAEQRSVVEPEFTYTGTRVATDPEGFMEAYAPGLDDPPFTSEQRQLFSSAVSDGLDPEEESIDSAAIHALINELDTPYAWAEGELYRVETEFVHEGTECFA